MTLTLHLPDEQTAAIQTRAEAQGLSAEQYIAGLLDRDLKTSRKHISQSIIEIASSLTPEDIASIPSDIASQHDYYCYGTPKRTDL